MLVLACVSCENIRANESDAMNFLIDIKKSKLMNIHTGLQKDFFIRGNLDLIVEEVKTESGIIEIYHLNADGVEVELHFDESNILYLIKTSSKKFKDAFENGVGTSLKKLKENYPRGAFVIGEEERRFANFITPGYVVFMFDTESFQNECFTFPKNCSYDESSKFVKQVSVIESDATVYLETYFNQQ